jgi:hypothetical protein
LIVLEGSGQTCTCDTSEPGNPAGTCVDNPSAAICSILLPDGSKIECLPGQEIGQKSRCGATSKYPCFCNPNLPGQIECPFCSSPLPDDDLLCLADGEDQLFIGSDNTAWSCSCTNGKTAAFPMVPMCEDLPPIGPGAMCNFTGSNGVPFQVNHGASLHEFFPNTGDNLEFPYCEFDTVGGGKTCAKTFTNADGRSESCDCIYVNSALGA